MADLLLLAVRVPGSSGSICGGFILSSEGGVTCEIAFRKDWERFVDPNDAEVLNGIEETLKDMAVGITAATFVQMIDDRLSNTIRCLDSMFVPSALPVNEHAELLRRSLLVDFPPLGLG
jgi:hypothetical protein